MEIYGFDHCRKLLLYQAAVWHFMAERATDPGVRDLYLTREAELRAIIVYLID